MQSLLYKILFIIISLSFVVNSPLLADEWQHYFAAGNKAYSEGRYEAAVGEYQKIIDNGIESGEVYFNIGNAYYKLNQIGKAILYYEKAALLIPGDEALQKNLSLARLKTVDKIEPIPKLFLTIWWNKAINLLALNVYGWLAIGLFTFTCLFIALFIFYNRRFWKRLSVFSGCLFVIALILFSGRIYQNETEKYAIVMDAKISVLSEPALTGTEVFILHEGTRVQIKRTLTDWAEITIADGKTGWCKQNGLGRI